jgi:hypothetical protein
VALSLRLVAWGLMLAALIWIRLVLEAWDLGLLVHGPYPLKTPCLHEVFNGL